MPTLWTAIWALVHIIKPSSKALGKIDEALNSERQKLVKLQLQDNELLFLQVEPRQGGDKPHRVLWVLFECCDLPEVVLPVFNLANMGHYT